ncbi:MAG TPA: hypothetical protein VNM36_00560 [Gemmatimonadaceae bacterium]|nr:hypothetical protein [Gemmatimonadaceae bacterium]
MRIRLLHPEFFADDVVWRLSDFAKLVFQGLWLIADREGRLADNVKMIDGQILSCDKRSCRKALLELEAAQRIRRYTTPAGPVIQVVRFGKWQHPHPNEKASQLHGNANEPLAPQERAYRADLNSNSDPVINSDPVRTDAPPARSDPNGSSPRAGVHQEQRRRVAPDGRAKRAASAPVDEALLAKHFGTRRR